MTIHMIGKNPNAAPQTLTPTAWSNGMSKPTTATSRATSSETSPEIQAVMRSQPSITKSVASGSAAISADAVSDPPTDSISGWNVAEYTRDCMATGSLGALKQGC